MSQADRSGADAIAEAVRLLAIALPSAGSTRVVAVDGPSGSGKTALAEALSRALHDAPVVHMDDLYPGWDGLADAVPRLLAWVLSPLAAGRSARYRRYDWGSGEYGDWQQVPGSRVLVVEGVASGSLAAAPHLALLVWVDAPLAVRLDRGISRDGEAYRPHWDRWQRQEERHFLTDRTAERADLTVWTHPPPPGDHAR